MINHSGSLLNTTHVQMTNHHPGIFLVTPFLLHAWQGTQRGPNCHLLEGETAARQVEIRQQEPQKNRKQNELLARQQQEQEAEGGGTKNSTKAKK